MVKLSVNGRIRQVDVEPEMPLLWVLRDHLGLNGEAVRSCTVPVSEATGKRVVTIEGLGVRGIDIVQKEWILRSVPQCGYCQSGMIMAAVALLARKRRPHDADIEEAMTNLCRCGTYARVREAIHAAAGNL